MEKNWWKEGIVYQIYPRSFNDGNHDGVGDLRGIIAKLDYLADLGIDIVWLCPVYKSPNDDNGYDVSDYQAISEEFGTMKEFDELLEGLHSRGIKLIMDLVVNHSSDEHKWFEEAKKSKDNPYRDYYIWKKGINGGPPNNWVSFFGGSAWEYDKESDEYYLHLFSKKQPDLNWENEKMRKDIYQMMHFWLKKGIDGFRMDVIPFISKYQDFPDIDPEDWQESLIKIYANGPRLHEYLQEMNREVLSKYDIMTVGEASGVPPEQALLYVDEKRKELDMIFHFGHLFMHNGPKGKFDTVEHDLNNFKDIFKIWEDSTKDGGWLSIFLGNHDFSRIVSRFGNDKEFLKESSKVLATLILSMKGTPYLYQGDEIGMKNLTIADPDELRDIETVNYYWEAVANGTTPEDALKRANIHGRDNARSPIQWSSKPYAGFSSCKPWLKVNDDYETTNVEDSMTDPDSILNYYKEMIRFRKSNPVLIYGVYEPIDGRHEQIFAYDRVLGDQKMRVILNFSENETSIPFELFPQWKLVFGNRNLEEEKDHIILPWEARIYKLLT